MSILPQVNVPHLELSCSGEAACAPVTSQDLWHWASSLQKRYRIAYDAFLTGDSAGMR